MGDKKETGVYQNCATQHRKRKRERERERTEKERQEARRDMTDSTLNRTGREGNGCVSKLRDSTQKEREREREREQRNREWSKERYDRLHLEQHGEGEGGQEGLLERTGQKDVGTLGGEGELEATQSSMERQLVTETDRQSQQEVQNRMTCSKIK